MLPSIDFETRSEIDLKKVGAYRYSEHPSTEILSLAYNLSGKVKPRKSVQALRELRDEHFMGLHSRGDLVSAVEAFNSTSTTKLWIPGMEDPEDLFEHFEKGFLVEAHNSFFERCIWSNVAVPKLLWPEIDPRQWRCSQAKTRASGIPGALGSAGKILNLKVQKDKRGEDLIKRLCKPRKPSKKDPRIWIEDLDLMEELLEYNVFDVESEIVLSENLFDMTETETRIWLVDQDMNYRGVPIDLEAVHAALEVLEETTRRYNQELKELTGGEITTSGQRDRVLRYCEELGFPLTGYTKADVSRGIKKMRKVLKRRIEPEVMDRAERVLRILEIRQILGKTSTAKYKKILERVATDGRVHEVVLYHKAHTGRWGGVGIQIQNLPRPTLSPPKVPGLKGAAKEEHETKFYSYLVDLIKTRDVDAIELEFGDVFEVCASSIRSMIKAPPGRKFYCADYSSIEARVLLWLAQDEEGLKLFESGGDPYVTMAAEIYGIPESEVTDDQRALGKMAILGLGYGMGAEKFVQSCMNMAGISIDIAFAKRVVNIYRTKFRSVVNLWSDTEKAALQAMRNPGKVIPCGRVKFKRVKDFLLCRLPSGRAIKYPFPELKEKETPWGEVKLQLHYRALKDGKWVLVSSYGGKLVENIDQGISRDIMAEALVNLEREGYPPIMTIHDEGVSEVDEGFGSLEEFCAIMARRPSWGQDIPIETDGWEGYRYRKS